MIYDVVHNYNYKRIHKRLGKPPAKVDREDIRLLNGRLRVENAPSIKELEKFKVGDIVRYLEEKSTFAKGGRKFRADVWTVIGIKGYNIKIQKDDIIKYKNHWELLKINL